MKQIDGKLDELAEMMGSMVKGFRIESGTIVLEEEVLPTSGSAFNFRIPCSNGAKLVDFHADADTLEAIKATSGKRYTASVLANSCASDIVNHYGAKRSLMMAMKDQGGSYGYMISDEATTVDNTDGLSFGCRALLAGTYQWIAYYWND